MFARRACEGRVDEGLVGPPVVDDVLDVVVVYGFARSPCPLPFHPMQALPHAAVFRESYLPGFTQSTAKYFPFSSFAKFPSSREVNSCRPFSAAGNQISERKQRSR